MDSDDVKHSITAEQPALIRKSLKSGAKRKLDVASDEDRGGGKASEDDAFEFGKNRTNSAVNKSSRSGPPRGETLGSLGSERCLQEVGADLSQTNVTEASVAIGKSRKALGPSESKIILSKWGALLIRIIRK